MASPAGPVSSPRLPVQSNSIFLKEPSMPKSASAVLGLPGRFLSSLRLFSSSSSHPRSLSTFDFQAAANWRHSDNVSALPKKIRAVSHKTHGEHEAPGG